MYPFKRILSLMLLACMTLGMVAVPVKASEITQPTEAAETVPETVAQTEAPEETSETTEPAEEVPETEEIPTEPTEPQVEPDAMQSQSSSMSFDTSGYTEEPNQVPLLLQTDYPDVPYGNGSVATSGCTMTCVAMVSTYLSGEECRPDVLAKRFAKDEASHVQRLEAASTVLDLVYRTTTSWQDVENALYGGKVAIVLLGEASEFTASQHTVVLTGVTRDGKILVNDPNGANYERWELKDGFANGFAPEMLQTGFGQAWIYEGYEPAAPGNSRYSELNLSDEDKKLIAGTVWLEARGESFEGQQAIAEIILNRRASGEFGDNIEWIIRAGGQFSSAAFLDDAKPGPLQYKAIERALTGPNVLPMNVYFFGRKAHNSNVWGQIGGHVFCYQE